MPLSLGPMKRPWIPETTTDLAVENHGSIFLFRPLSQDGREWLHTTAPEDAQWHGLALAVEHRYANEVAVCALDAGLNVS